MKNRHLIWMIIGCTLPLLLIFFAPALGLGSNVSLLIFIVAMFACHLFMPHGHGGMGRTILLTKKKNVMNTIHIRKFGLAVGLTWALLYLGCAIVMLTVGKEGTVLFFNSLLHGLDTNPIIRMDMPFFEMCIGLIESFILGWLVGACIAGIYNFSLVKK